MDVFCVYFGLKSFIFVKVDVLLSSGSNIHILTLSKVKIQVESALFIQISGYPKLIVSPYNQYADDLQWSRGFV